MSYTIENKPANKRGWHTPDEARRYYGKYSRTGITVHWWGLPNLNPDSKHDNIVSYILGKARAGTGSVNYVVSNKKITQLVHPDNVAWASQRGNPTTVSIEFSPNLNAEGYKKAGWLIWRIEKRYNRKMTLYPHKYWYSTQCPGHLSLSRMRDEANKWAKGAYNPKPKAPKWVAVDNKGKWVAITDTKVIDVVTGKKQGTIKKGTVVEITTKTTYNGKVYLRSKWASSERKNWGIYRNAMKVYQAPKPKPEPTPPEVPKAKLKWEKLRTPVVYVANKQPTKLWDFDAVSWSMDEVKRFDKGAKITIYGKVVNETLKATYLLTEYSYEKKIAHGFNEVDLDKYQAPPKEQDPAPTPPPEQEPVKPPKDGEVIDKKESETVVQLNWIKRALEAILGFFGIKLN